MCFDKSIRCELEHRFLLYCRVCKKFFTFIDTKVNVENDARVMIIFLLVRDNDFFFGAISSEC